MMLIPYHMQYSITLSMLIVFEFAGGIVAAIKRNEVKLC